MSQNRLARMLKPLGIGPENVGPEMARARGYKLSQPLLDAFERYLPPKGASELPLAARRFGCTGVGEISP